MDPKNRDLSIYKNADIITPNLKELFEATESNLIPNQKTIEKLSRKIIKDFGFQHVITTKSSDGISLVSKKLQTLHLPSKAKEVFDVSGAGDTVIASIAVFLNMGMSLDKAVKLSNIAAGQVVKKLGTSTTSIHSIYSQITKNKYELKNINNKNYYMAIINSLKKNSKKIVMTNGCFDLLHAGHIELLRKSKTFE